jgi:hypothetical protein
MEKVDSRYDRYVAVILETDSSELAENCSSLLLPLGSRPILSYQLACLEANRVRRRVAGL